MIKLIIKDVIKCSLFILFVIAMTLGSLAFIHTIVDKVNAEKGSSK